MRTPRFPPGKLDTTFISWHCRYGAVRASCQAVLIHCTFFLHIYEFPAARLGSLGSLWLWGAAVFSWPSCTPVSPADSAVLTVTIPVPLAALPTQQVSAAAPEAGEANPGGGGGGNLIHGMERPWGWRHSRHKLPQSEAAKSPCRAHLGFAAQDLMDSGVPQGMKEGEAPKCPSSLRWKPKAVCASPMVG